SGYYVSNNDRTKKQVQTLSCGLAEVIPSSGAPVVPVVQFIHQSVKDFFVEKGLSILNESSRSADLVGKAHYQLSRTCVRYLAMEEIAGSTSHDRHDMMSKFPFLHYATTS